MFRMGNSRAVRARGRVLVGCSQPITVDTIQIGRSLNADQSVASQTTTFKPNETVYVSALEQRARLRHDLA